MARPAIDLFYGCGIIKLVFYTCGNRKHSRLFNFFLPVAAGEKGFNNQECFFYLLGLAAAAVRAISFHIVLSRRGFPRPAANNPIRPPLARPSRSRLNSKMNFFAANFFKKAAKINCPLIIGSIKSHGGLSFLLEARRPVW